MTVCMMPLAAVLDLDSGDYDERVGDILSQVPLDGDFHVRLAARMRETRACAVPVLVEDGTLLNGHHRVALAAQIGLAEVPVTDDDRESGYLKYNTLV